MTHFIVQSFGTPKLNGAALDLTLQKVPFQFSSKLHPLFLNGSFQVWKVLSYRKKKYQQKPNNQPWFMPKFAAVLTIITISTTENSVVRLLQHSELPTIIASSKKMSRAAMHSQFKPRLKPPRDLIPLSSGKA